MRATYPPQSDKHWLTVVSLSNNQRKSRRVEARRLILFIGSCYLRSPPPPLAPPPAPPPPTLAPPPALPPALPPMDGFAFPPPWIAAPPRTSEPPRPVVLRAPPLPVVLRTR